MRIWTAIKAAFCWLFSRKKSVFLQNLKKEHDELCHTSWFLGRSDAKRHVGAFWSAFYVTEIHIIQQEQKHIMSAAKKYHLSKSRVKELIQKRVEQSP